MVTRVRAGEQSLGGSPGGAPPIKELRGRSPSLYLGRAVCVGLILIVSPVGSLSAQTLTYGRWHLQMGDAGASAHVAADDRRLHFECGPDGILDQVEIRTEGALFEKRNLRRAPGELVYLVEGAVPRVLSGTLAAGASRFEVDDGERAARTLIPELKRSGLLRIMIEVRQQVVFLGFSLRGARRALTQLEDVCRVQRASSRPAG